MILILNLIGFAFIGFIIGWFWLSQPKTTKITDKIIRIAVKGGIYSPARIEVDTHQTITLEFTRSDTAHCSDTVIFSTLDKQITLPLNQPQRIEIGHLAPGKYPFACPMNMYAGELIVC
jgi:plastocyanin domain-containing protein